MIRKIIHIDEEKCNGCGGLQRAAGNALQASGKSIPLRVRFQEMAGLWTADYAYRAG